MVAEVEEKIEIKNHRLLILLFRKQLQSQKFLGIALEKLVPTGRLTTKGKN